MFDRHALCEPWMMEAKRYQSYNCNCILFADMILLVNCTIHGCIWWTKVFLELETQNDCNFSFWTYCWQYCTHRISCAKVVHEEGSNRTGLDWMGSETWLAMCFIVTPWHCSKWCHDFQGFDAFQNLILISLSTMYNTRDPIFVGFCCLQRL